MTAKGALFHEGSDQLRDLEETREEVIREVYNAPRRRVDNEVSSEAIEEQK
jgi:hypothetical protein